MRSVPFVLVPPSQAKSEGGAARFSPRRGTFSALAGERHELVEALGLALAEHPEMASKLFGATGPLLDRAVDALACLGRGTARALPAAKRYEGVVWDHLDPGTLSDDQVARLIVPSALLGVSAGGDPTPDYRLTFGVSVPGLGRLDRWWRDTVTKALIDQLAGETVIDMLPNEHAAVVDFDELAVVAEVIRVRFVAQGGRRAAGHGAKAAKGRAAHVALTGGTRALARFSWEGWQSVRTDAGFDIVAPG